MKFVTVIPLAKNVRQETLSYFSAKDINAGTVVSAPLRNKIIDAIVVDSVDARMEKSTLKDASFALKKITKIKGASFLDDPYMHAASDSAKYFASPIGSFLHQAVPQSLLESFAKLKPRPMREIIAPELKHEKLIFQAPLIERLSYYKTYIRESFAKKKSIFFCLPTIEDIERFREVLEKGIESYTITLSSDTSTKNIIAAYNRVATETHPLLIIATPSFMVFPDHMVGTIILEHESAHAYRTASSPYIDFRILLEHFAESARIKLILGDTLLRIETLWRRDEDELGEVVPPTYRVHTLASIDVEDMRRTKPDGTRKPFKLFSKNTEELIGRKLSEKKHVFLFALRKGLSSVTVCKDCSATVSCDVCGSPLVLYPARGIKSRIFACNKCKKQKDPNTVCSNCGSWNLLPLGIGTDLVEEQAVKLWPDVPIFRIDREVTKTRLQARRVMEQFKKSQGGILIGTEMALLYLPETLDTSIVVSLDSLFTIPSFRMTEKILHIVLALAERTLKSIVIQTQNPDEKVVRSLVSGNLLYVIRDELAERSRYVYPPYATFIKVSFRGTREQVLREKKIMQDMFAEFNPILYQGFGSEREAKFYMIHATIKLSRTDWAPEKLVPNGTVDERLLSILKSLPPSYKVQVDPEDLL